MTFLLTDSDLTGLVGTDIFDRELPAGEEADMPASKLVVNPVGGSEIQNRSMVRVGDINVDLQCYGDTPYNADKVARAAYQAMKHLGTAAHDDADENSTQLKSAYPIAGPISLRDQDNGWPLTVYTFKLIAGETAAA